MLPRFEAVVTTEFLIKGQAISILQDANILQKIQ